MLLFMILFIPWPENHLFWIGVDIKCCQDYISISFYVDFSHKLTGIQPASLLIENMIFGEVGLYNTLMCERKGWTVDVFFK